MEPVNSSAIDSKHIKEKDTIIIERGKYLKNVLVKNK